MSAALQETPPSPPFAKLTIVPVSLASVANTFVERTHRHNRPVQGAKFCIGVAEESSGLLRGVAIVGRPVSQLLQDGMTLEVTRCCTDGCPNACSMLYSAARTAAFAQGYRRLVTYTLQSESMASLKGAGWTLVAEVDPHAGSGWLSRPGRREQPPSRLPKYRWETYAKQKARIFPIVLPWQSDQQVHPKLRELRPPETLIYTGKGNLLDLAATIELTARVTTEEQGGFSAWDVSFALDVEQLKAQDCHLAVGNPPTIAQVMRVLDRIAHLRPDRLLSYGHGWYCWIAEGSFSTSPDGHIHRVWP
jgi:hypothetical protein